MGGILCYDSDPMGRPRIHASNADRQRAYRERRAKSSPKEPRITQRAAANMVHVSVRTVQRIERMERWDETVLDGWCKRQLEQPNASVRGIEERAQTRITMMLKEFTATELERFVERAGGRK